jgi:hypothetical protein
MRFGTTLVTWVLVLPTRGGPALAQRVTARLYRSPPGRLLTRMRTTVAP